MNTYRIRLLVLTVMAVLAVGLAPNAAFAELKLTVSPTKATANSVWTFQAVWTQDKAIPPSPANPAGATSASLAGEDGTVMLSGLGKSVGAYGGIPMYLVKSENGGKTRTYRVSVSAGLNMSRMEQWPDRPTDDDPTSPTFQYIDPTPFDASSFLPTKASCNNLLWDPEGHPLWYAPLLTVVGERDIKAYAYELGDEYNADLVRVEAAPAVGVTVVDSKLGGSPIDYGGTDNGDADSLTCYPGLNWPLSIDVDPLTVQPNWADNKTAPDDGGSSNEFIFRVRYHNDAGLPPKPWVRSGWIYLGSGAEVPFSGVVLYLDKSGTGDYQMYPMYPEDPTLTDLNGAVFFAKILPFDGWQGTNIDAAFPGYSIDGWAYNSLSCGAYHYFFGCSDDSFTFNYTDDTPFLFDFQPNLAEWGVSELDILNYKENSALDPKLSRGVTDYAAVDRAPGRRYSDQNGYRFDDSIYVDRQVSVPGLYDTWEKNYPYKATEHPIVSCQLTVDYLDSNNVYLDDWLTYGGGLYYGTIWPFKRAVNPILPGAYGFGTIAQRAETCGVRTQDEVEFRIKYVQYENKPPIYMRLMVNNASSRSKVENNPYSDNLPSSKYTYVGYPMYPDLSDTGVLDYQGGVWYRYRMKLPAGPHTYYFEASDGTNKTTWPRRPDRYTYNGVEFTDIWVPNFSTQADYGTATYDDNDYVPGPYVNSPPSLSNHSVTPSSGKAIDKYTFRVTYTDPDGQSPSSAYIYLQTGVGDVPKKCAMVPETLLDPAVNNSAQYKQPGVVYKFETSTVEDLVMANGTRRYYFEFTDNWGRQTDSSDVIPGETTVLTNMADGTKRQWIQGPTISGPTLPTLLDGTVESADGTRNSATLWTFKVKYIGEQKMDGDTVVTPSVKVLIGQLQDDGKTVLWDDGHSMEQVDPGDKVYSDGAVFSYPTRLSGQDKADENPKQYYYAFTAWDGAVWAEYDAVASPSAGVEINQLLTTSDNKTYTIPRQVAGAPIVGPLPVWLPSTPNDLTGADVYVGGTLGLVNGIEQLVGAQRMSNTDERNGWQSFGDLRYSVMKGNATKNDGTSSSAYVVPDQPDLIASVEGVYASMDDLQSDTNNYYDPTLDLESVRIQGGVFDPSDQTKKIILPTDTWRIGRVLGVYKSYAGLNELFDGTFAGGAAAEPVATAAINSKGQIVANASQAADSVFYIKYARTGFVAGDSFVWLTSELPDANKGGTVYIKYSDIRFTRQMAGFSSSVLNRYVPNGAVTLKAGLDPAGPFAAPAPGTLAADRAGGVVGVWGETARTDANLFNWFRSSGYLADIMVGSDYRLTLTTDSSWIGDDLYMRYYQSGACRIDRWNGKVEFSTTAARTARATYIFGTPLTDTNGDPILIGVNTAPVLMNGVVTPTTGAQNATYEYSVIYKDTDGPNGQKPDYVKLYIDDVAYPMAPADTGGTPVYRDGVKYSYSKSGLQGANHNYRFEASDASAIAWLDKNGLHNKDIPGSMDFTPGTPVYVNLDGPWINDPPTLTGGTVSPSTISVGQSVDYFVTYKDADNDAPYNGYPQFWVDSAADTDLIYTGKVVSLIADTLETTKKRTIVAVNDSDVSPGWTPDQFAGKLLQVSNGLLDGTVFMIQSNTADTLVIATDDLSDSVVTTPGSETTFRINGLLMSRTDPNTVANYSQGVQFKLTAPRLAVGSHTFRFMARSSLTKPAWYTEPVLAYSGLVKLSGTGPTVTSSAPDGNVAPVLTAAALTSIYSGPFSKAADVVTATSVKLNTGTGGNWTLTEAQNVREVYGIYMNATLDANSDVENANHLSTSVTTIPSTNVLTLSTPLVAPDAADDLIQFGSVGTSLLWVTPDHAASIDTVSGVFLESDPGFAGTNYYSSFNGTKVILASPLPSGTKRVYIRHRIKDGVTWPQVYVKYFRDTPTTKFLASDPITFKVSYRDADNDAPTFHSGVQGYVRLVFSGVNVPYGMMVAPSVTLPVNSFITDVPFQLTLTDTPQGVRKYHFEGSDGYDPDHLVRFPELSSGNANDYSISVNYRPTLTVGKVEPAVGQPQTQFSFSVFYKDLDGSATGAPTPSVKLRLIKDGTTEAIYTMQAAANPVYANGVTYSYQITNLVAGNYSVRFEANDGYEDSIPIGNLAIRVRNTNIAPEILSYTVDPDFGKTNQVFRFTATYRDADGDAPVATILGVRYEGLALLIDEGTSHEQTKLLTKVPVTPEPTFDDADGVQYQLASGITGRSLGTGKHTYTIKATDGSLDATLTPVSKDGPVVLVPFFDSLRAVSITAVSPETATGLTSAAVGDEVLLEGLIKFPKKDSTPAKPAEVNNISVKITKPDGTSVSVVGTATMLGDETDADNWVGRIQIADYPQGVDAALVTGTSVTLCASGQWTFSASWPGDSAWDAGATSGSGASNANYSLYVGGPMRALAITSANVPMVDMVTPAMENASGDVGAIFGYDRAPLMQIVRWDPVSRSYSRYGSGTFPSMSPGDAVWIKPKSDYPAETVYLMDYNSGLLSMGGLGIPDFTRSYRLIRTLSKAYTTQTNSVTGNLELKPCTITLSRGWNQFGNIFFNWKKDSSGEVITPKEDVGIPIRELKVKYLNQELSLAEAKRLGWIRDYAWRYDALTRQYVLVSDTSSERVLKAWSGFWIRSFVDCQLVINPNTTYNGGALGAASVAVQTATEQVDEPPTAPE